MTEVTRMRGDVLSSTYGAKWWVVDVVAFFFPFNSPPIKKSRDNTLLFTFILLGI
jgi:hypothetical protein